MRPSPRGNVSGHRLWDIVIVWLSACVMWVAGPDRVAAQAKPLTQSPWLYRIARASHTPDVDVLLARAERHVDAGLVAFPTSFRVICERTQQLRLSVDSDAVRKGRSRAIALFAQQAQVRRAALDRALAELDRAERMDPASAEVARARAQALVLWEEPASLESCEVRQRTAEAIDALRRWHALRPEQVSSASMYELGGLYARQTAYASAATAYRRAVALAFDDAERSAAYAQLAQVTMLGGDAAAALPYFQRALENAQPGKAVSLLRFGLAVALDRLGDHPAALEQAKLALEASERSLEVLAPDNIQFEPASERYVYQALAHEAQAQLMPEARALSLEAAAAAYAAFLGRVDASHLYRNAAEADLRAVVSQLESPGAR